MKRSTLTLAVLLFAAFQTILAGTVNITISGFSYSPSSTTASIGDVVTIDASTTHPLVQVDQSTWNANGNTPMAGGWGTKTSAYTFTITTMGDIYYACANHASIGMKGMITVIAAGIQQIAASAYSINLYPNPMANGEFTVKAEGYPGGQGKVLLYNETGQVLESHKLAGATTVVKTQLPSGIYFYAVMVGTQPVYRNKLVVTQNK